MNIIVSGDGSHTIYVPELREHYHSSFGAVTESDHVFIRAGLSACENKSALTVFEAGFGTGLNALLSCIYAANSGIRLLYYALEKYPLADDIIAALNYPSQIPSAHEINKLFLAIHQAPWHKTVAIRDEFHLHKIHADLTVFAPEFYCDLIYFDAFAPEKQPELWTYDIFKRIYNALNMGGILTTYCVKGEVKRMLKLAGFKIEKLPGPPGKREILRAWKL